MLDFVYCDDSNNTNRDIQHPLSSLLLPKSNELMLACFVSGGTVFSINELDPKRRPFLLPDGSDLATGIWPSSGRSTCITIGPKMPLPLGKGLAQVIASHLFLRSQGRMPFHHRIHAWQMWRVCSVSAQRSVSTKKVWGKWGSTHSKTSNNIALRWTSLVPVHALMLITPEVPHNPMRKNQ